VRSQYRKRGYSLKNEAVLRSFSKYSDDLYRFALSYTGSKCEAEDIVQDVPGDPDAWFNISMHKEGVRCGVAELDDKL